MTIHLSLLLKIVGLILLFIATVVGCYGHFSSYWLEIWKQYPSWFCEYDPDCPHNATAMERTFVAFSIIILILSVISLVVGVLLKSKQLFLLIDAIFYIIGGLIILISSILLIVAAAQIDNAVRGEARDYYQFGEKISAGILGLICGLLYIATAGFIVKDRRELYQ